MHMTDIKTANIASKTLKPVFSRSKNTNVSAAVINIAPQIGTLIEMDSLIKKNRIIINYYSLTILAIKDLLLTQSQ